MEEKSTLSSTWSLFSSLYQTWVISDVFSGCLCFSNEASVSEVEVKILPSFKNGNYVCEKYNSHLSMYYFILCCKFYHSNYTDKESKIEEINWVSSVPFGLIRNPGFPSESWYGISKLYLKVFPSWHLFFVPRVLIKNLKRCRVFRPPQ